MLFSYLYLFCDVVYLLILNDEDNMITIEDNFGFYGILTNPVRGYDYVTNLLVDNEIRFIQLRMKNGSDYDKLKVAESMKKITEASNTSFIMNDSAQIALDSGADGVHVGQGDMSVADVRKLVGSEMIVGLSTHNPTETKAAQSEAVNYIGVGPVYVTPTKDIPDPVLGLETMKEMIDISKVPAVTLGGIDFDRLPKVLEGGSRNYSMVRPICSSENPSKELAEILEIQRRFM